MNGSYSHLKDFSVVTSIEMTVIEEKIASCLAMTETNKQQRHYEPSGSEVSENP